MYLWRTRLAGGRGITCSRPGLSASRFATRDRPDYQRLLADISAGKLDVVVLWEASRGDRKLATCAAVARSAAACCRCALVTIVVLNMAAATVATAHITMAMGSDKRGCQACLRWGGRQVSVVVAWAADCHRRSPEREGLEGGCQHAHTETCRWYQPGSIEPSRSAATTR